jgi:hypothetical protein
VFWNDWMIVSGFTIEDDLRDAIDRMGDRFLW